MDELKHCILFNTLPEELFGSVIFPYLSFRDMQVFDTAVTNKFHRPQLHKLWKSCQYTSMNDEKLIVANIKWLHNVGISIFSMTLHNDSLDSDDPLSEALLYTAQHISSLKQLTISGRCYVDEPLQAMARSCQQLEVLCLPYGEFTNEAVLSIAQHCRHLHTIYISSRYISDAAVHALCVNCPYLLHIRLSHCRNITDAAVTDIASTYPHLLSIDISGCRLITDDALCFLANHCQALQSIGVGGSSNISRTGLTALWTANPNLTSVNISDNYFLSDIDVISLLQCCPQLHELNMYNCGEITDAAVIAVAEHCPQLTSLDISHCDDNLSDDSLIALGQHCHELKCIDISGLNVSYDGVVALAEGCPLLQEFRAQEMNFTDYEIVAIASGCHNLRKIDICYCHAVSFDGISCIAEHCPLISELRLFQCSVDDECLRIIAQHCRNLISLDISIRTDESFVAVIDVINGCPQLRFLRFPISFQVANKEFLSVCKSRGISLI